MKFSFDSKSFSVDGERTLILSGEVHYFRMPKEEWKPVLQSVVSCGLNAVSTYIPWNLHEPQEGKWDFKGDKDLEAFLKLCKQLKLFVIAKPGPFISAGWNFGGFPAWLHAKDIQHLRTSDTRFMASVDRYLDKVLGLLARNQVNKGGPVCLIQIEDSFDMAPQDPAYLRHLESKFKKRVSAPVFFSLGDTNNAGGHVPGSMIAACFSDGASGHLKRLMAKHHHPRQPRMVSKLKTGTFNGWGKPAEIIPVEDIRNSLTETLGAGAAWINQKMFFGGTNFGDSAGRSVGGDSMFVTTSFDNDAPIAEGGEKTDKALSLGLWARWARCLEPILLGSEVVEEDHPIVPEEAGVTARVLGQSRIYFLHNPTDQMMHGKIHLDEPVPFHLKPGARQAFPVNLPVTPNLSLRASTHPYIVEQLGARTVVVLWGKPGEKISLYGTGTLDVVARSNEKVQLEHERAGFVINTEVSDRPQRLFAKIMFESGDREVMFVIVNRKLAENISVSRDKLSLVLGSSEVDFQKKLARMNPGAQTLIHVSASAYEEEYVSVATTSSKKETLSVKGVLAQEALLKRAAARKDWKPAEVGKDFSEYGFSSSRAWYRLKFKTASKGKKTFIFPDFEDKFSVFHSGKFLGTYGRLGKGPKLEITAAAGENELYLLAETWGRYSFGTKLLDKKGLMLPVFDGGNVQPFEDAWHVLEAEGPLDPQVFSSPSFAGRGWETAVLGAALVRKNYVCARKKFKVPEGVKRLRLNLHGGDVEIHVSLNAQFVGRHTGALGSQYKEFELTDYLIAGENTVALFFKGPTKDFAHCELLFLGQELKMDLEICEGLAGPDETAALKDKAWAKNGKKDRFGFWKAEFKGPALKGVSSASLTLSKMGRGSVWVNNHPIGRFWKKGPQAALKIPLAWLKPKNEILVFEEDAPLGCGGSVTYKVHKAEVKFK